MSNGEAFAFLVFYRFCWVVSVIYLGLTLKMIITFPAIWVHHSICVNKYKIAVYFLQWTKLVRSINNRNCHQEL